MSDHLHRRWNDVRTMLTDWLAWLDETQHWAETTGATDMSSNLEESPSIGTKAVVSQAGDAPDDSAPRSDLSSLLAAMTALRQEVNLQTRSARRDREQASETLEALSSVVDQLTREPEEEEPAPDVDTVHVDVLLDLHDALSRAERQASQVIASAVDTLSDWHTQHEVETEADGESQEPPGEVYASVSAARTNAFGRLRGWFGRAAQPAVEPSTVAPEPTDRAATVDDVSAWVEIGVESGRMADRLDGLVTGYRLSLQRLERILLTCGIEPIPCLGQSVDPELMEVVQIVSDSTEPPGMVTDEVRCGYWRYGQVYRYAQVVATRADAVLPHTPAEHIPDGQASEPP